MSNPKNALLEYCQQHLRLSPHSPGWPSWQFETEGKDHNLTFHATVQFNQFGQRIVARGTGKTRKEAEKAAAQEALSRLDVDVTPPPMARDPELMGLNSNAKSQLFEFFQARGVLVGADGWPQFVLEGIHGPDHMREFTVLCRAELQGRFYVGTGRSNTKLMAEKIAASHVLRDLKRSEEEAAPYKGVEAWYGAWVDNMRMP